MQLPTKYNCLIQNEFVAGDYKIVPIRYEDRLDIMQWRNEQMYHLRQDKPLTAVAQDNYFKTVVSELFEKDNPKQILFSFLENNICIGYGGLVHMNWIDKYAEISFIMNTIMERESFKFYWTEFLNLIEEVAFIQLKLHKVFVYAFDLRPNLYDVLKANNYFNDAVLKEHCLFEGNYIDVVIHSKISVI
jgi:hypothetical protein